MKLKKTFTFIDKNQIWRLLISDSDKLLIETRDTENKEVFFHFINLENGKTIFKNFQMDEKYWIGVEKIYKNKIIFHHYAKPDMPEHKKIIVYDTDEDNIVWQNNDLIFLTITDDKIYAYKKKFEGKEIFVLDFFTGEIIDDLGNDENKISDTIQNLNFEDYSDYKYPETYIPSENNKIDEIIQKEINKKGEINNIDKLIYKDFLMFNYHIKKENNFLDNVFTVYNIDKKKKVVSEMLNKNLNSFSPDSFFCYKNNLIILKNKSDLICFRIV